MFHGGSEDAGSVRTRTRGGAWVNEARPPWSFHGPSMEGGASQAQHGHLTNASTRPPPISAAVRARAGCDKSHMSSDIVSEVRQAPVHRPGNLPAV